MCWYLAESETTSDKDKNDSSQQTVFRFVIQVMLLIALRCNMTNFVCVSVTAVYIYGIV